MNSKIIGIGRISMMKREIRWADIEEDDHVFLNENNLPNKTSVEQQLEQLNELENDHFLEIESSNIFLPLIKGKCSRAARRQQKLDVLDDDIDEILKEFGLGDSLREMKEVEEIVNNGCDNSIGCRSYQNKVSKEFIAESTARALGEIKSRNKKQKKKSSANNYYY
ncbi:unnamed protein product [Cryptosporidium hominis]|uniref:Uncharacterized protein n=1 Tax=Cryptosporidium hominis TaxID=237895 RepID=A0A0S4TCB5_CRYHO|nr:hypothetical protein [Cryptosporidium hominis TU502]OLQ18524.1 hypothetical protein ChTU502y2012_411g0005 [Cryptosporidium hominis]PPA63999.1 hypothetical protein ChUKH1_06135 [Cryptosporidium hominis]PPS96947.1 Uncharacterized protein GY17_00001168 [Cryptosporidium hominis]CUV04105.1 unnamed protein product [Cryptosporidium hominis]|eukprot:PPS96947.1 Uncharacterized protein GY17_00001168 [Cryptosporidium hominis]